MQACRNDPVQGTIEEIIDFRPIPWLAAFSVGHPTIDGEHRQMVECANGICALVAEGAGFRVVAAAMTALLTDVEGHFATEERMFAAIGYPEIESHRAAHRVLRDDLAACLRGFSPVATAQEFAITVRGAVLGIVDHILRHDSRYKTFILARQGL